MASKKAIPDLAGSIDDILPEIESMIATNITDAIISNINILDALRTALEDGLFTIIKRIQDKYTITGSLMVFSYQIRNTAKIIIRTR